MMKGILILIFVSLIFGGCSSSSEKIDNYFNKLGEQEAAVIFEIDNKAFYAPNEVFAAEAYISKDIFNLTLTSKKGDRTIISLGGENWFHRSPISSTIKRDDPLAANVKIGKMVDLERMIGEGYMMTDGEITAVEFTKDRMVFEIKGMAGKYSDFEAPDKYLAVKGLIVCKRPQVNIAGINESQIFGSH